MQQAGSSRQEAASKGQGAETADRRLETANSKVTFRLILPVIGHKIYSLFTVRSAFGAESSRQKATGRRNKKGEGERCQSVKIYWIY